MKATSDPVGIRHGLKSYTVRNQAVGTVLASAARTAATSAARRQGLLQSDFLSSGEGLWIVPCEAIHTFRMKFSIDAVFVDRAHRVRKIYAGLVPWRIAGCLRADSVLELPAGSLAESRTSIGDQLEFLSNESEIA